MSDIDLRRLARLAAQGDHQAGYALHVERARRGMRLLPDETVDLNGHIFPPEGTELEYFYFFGNKLGASVLFDGVRSSLNIGRVATVKLFGNRYHKRTLVFRPPSILGGFADFGDFEGGFENPKLQERLYKLMQMPVDHD